MNRIHADLLRSDGRAGSAPPVQTVRPAEVVGTRRMSEQGRLSYEPMTELPEWERLRVRRAEFEYAAVRKDARIAYGLWAVTGIFGGHRFYLGDTARSIAMLFTLGGCGLWTLADVFLIGRRVRTVNRSRRAEVMARNGIIEAT